MSSVLTSVEVNFIPDGYNYYAAYQWYGNDDYYVVFFVTEPQLIGTIDYMGTEFYTLSDGNVCLYYRFESYDEMEAYLKYNDASGVDYVYEKNTIDFVRINENNTSDLYYSNFDYVFAADGSLYAAANEYRFEDVYLVGEFLPDELYEGLSAEIIPILAVVLCVLCGIISVRKGIWFLVRDFLRRC